jgi:GT2 family glycosyltransferase
MSAAATVLIVTKDRREELLRAVEGAVAQEGEPEVLVIDDASGDGSADAVEQAFPSVRVLRSERSEGAIAQRNRGVGEASTPLVVSVDDDVVFPSRATVAQTVRDFDHPRVGAVAVPFIDVRHSRDVQQHALSEDGVWVASGFIGCACAVRRDAFQVVGGFRRALGQYWEEPDLALRTLDRGWITRLGRADPIEHHESSARVQERKLMLGRRNGILTACFTVPARSLPGHLAWLTANTLVTAATEGPPGPLLRGTAIGYRDAVKLRGERHPVDRTVFRLRQRLWRQGPERLDAVEGELPAL